MGKSAPKAPDPYATAAAQTQSNLATAQATAKINRDGTTTTPYGTSTTTDGPNGFNTTQTLSPSQQAIFDQQQQTTGLTANAAHDAAGRLGTLLGSPLDTSNVPGLQYDNNATVQAATDAINARLQPQFERDQGDLNARLAAQGITQGSPAYEREQTLLGQKQNDAETQAVLAGENQAAQQTQLNNTTSGNQLSRDLTLRNQPINETSALFGLGSQVQAPQQQQYAPVNVDPTNISGLIQNQYQSQLQKQAANNGALGSILGTVAGVGGSILGGPAGGAGASLASKLIFG